MKKIILFSIFILCCSSTLLHAQVPGGIMFQAVARDVNGNIASERNIHIKVNIQTENNSNTSVYSEIFEVISSKEGIFSVVIGNGNWLSGANSIIDLDWNNNIYYLNLNVAVEPSLYDPSWNYQDKYVDLGTSQIWSVPYSFNAETANNINGILSGENGGTGVNNEGKTISLDGNLSLVGDFNLTINTTADSNITLPTSGTLATISDVTSEILSVNSNLSTIQEEIDNTQLGAGLQNDGSYVPNTSANYINTATNLSNATEILDNQISLNTSLIQNINNQKLNLTGGVMSGTLDMGSNSITNIASPINNQDAANKSYVDTAVTQIDITKLEIGLEKGKFFIGDSSNLAQGINLTGDISTNISGVVTISNDAVNSTKILDGTITSSDIANESIVDNSLATISTAGKIANSATSATKNNSPDTIVLRDENGNFSAGIITADVIGNSSSASKFESPITIAGQSFDGTANIEIEPSDLTGVTVLASEINYLTGATSNIQNQLDGKAENNDLNSLVDRVTLNESAITSNALNIAANTTSITTNTSDIGTNTTDITTLQSEVNATQTGAGLGTDGTYTADSSSNYLTTVTSLTGADTALDTQLKSVADEVASLSTSSSSEAASIQSELDATQTGAGLGTDGSYTADSSSNYITSVTSLAAADSALDAQIKNNTDALSNVSVNDATTTSKGIVKLAGDLGGTADLPTVPGLANKEDTANKSTTTSLGTSDVLFPTQNAVKTYVDNQIASGSVADATTSIKGIVKLAGDLSGTADLPTVPSLGLKENISHKSASTALGNSDVLYPTQKAVKTYVDQQLTVFDATSIVKGKIKLAGDLGGTADLPTVPGLSSKEDTSNKSTTTTLGNSDVLYPTQNAVKTYVDTQIATESVADATTTTKGVLMLSGDLSGTADSPTVPDLILKENASLKSSNVDLGSSDVLYPTQNAVKTYVDSQISSLSSASDASSTVKGILKLTGDLGGTADLPTVPGLANKEDAANKSTTTSLGTSDDLFPTQNAVKTYVDTQITSSLSLDATSSVKGILKLTGDLSGTADTPTVPGLLLKAPINNPNLTGVPTAPTADSGTNTTQIATTAFVADAVTGVAASGVFVDLTSDQTVGGEKTFTSDISISATLTAGGTALPSSTGTAGQVLMISSSGVAQWTTIIQEINVEVSATASQTSFTLSQVPSDRSTIKMYINGVRVSNSAYSLSSLTVTYNPANNGSYTIMSGDRIQFDYYY